MRKLTLTNYILGGRHSSKNIVGLLNTHILRTQGGYRSNDFLNEVCSKLTARGAGWIRMGDNSESVVIINDARKEIAQHGNRSLVTTGLIYEELLQTNRGHQDYEYERNKFFTQDATSNARDISSSDTLHLVDLLWHMTEGKYDAVEITTDALDNGLEDFFSERYRSIISKLQDDAHDKEVPRILKLGNDYFAWAKKEDGGTLDWTEHHKRRNAHDFYEDREEEYYGREYDMVKKYLEYRRTLCYSEDNDDYSVVPTSYQSWEEWLSEFIIENKHTQRSFSPSIIASAYGYADCNYEGLDLVLGVGFSGVMGATAQYKKIASSQYKRNSDWHCDHLNFYKSEVLKLRNQMLGKSYYE